MRGLWLLTLGGVLELSPMVGVAAGMVYVHDWAATHEAFLLQDFILVTMLALLVGLAAAPVALAAVHTVLGLVLLVAAVSLGIVLVAVLYAGSLLAFTCLLALRFAEDIRDTLVHPRCDSCGRHHERPVSRLPAIRSGLRKPRPAGA